jgi:phage gp29-like protein
MATKNYTTSAKPPKAEMASMIATSGDGRDITKPFVAELEQPRDARLLGSRDWGVYAKIRKDDQVKSCMEQRIRAVVCAEWDVVPGDETDLKSVEAAASLKDNIAQLGWDRITKKMLWAVFHGISIAELKITANDGLWSFGEIRVRNARRFRFDKDGGLRLLTKAAAKGEVLPERKFWIVTEGATDDDELYGEGLADWLYWPTFFKRNGIRFWNIFLDKFGTPTAKVTYSKGAAQKDIDKAIGILQALAQDSGIAVPEGIAVEFLQVARSGVGDYKDLCRYMDEAIAKIILSQTMTTQDGASLSQAQVHAGVKLDVVKADADLLSDSFNEGPARWWTDWNYGPEVASPQLVRMVDEEADLKVTAETDAILANQGWVRTPESFKDIYGDGFERKVLVDATSAGAQKDAAIPAGQNDNAPVVPKPDKKAVSFAATDPRPLYVYRQVKNAAELLAWAKAQGFTSTLKAADLHVTVTYSKRPVDWFKMGSPWGPDGTGQLIVPAGGPRVVDRLGDQGAVVLHFSSADLEWRHENMVNEGASWDFAEYHPHVTISYDGAPADLSAIEPYQGKLVFGPEVFEPIENDWQTTVKENSFAEPAKGDVIDQMVEDMLALQGWKPLSPQIASVIAAIEASGSVEDLDASLFKSLSADDSALLKHVLATATFAARIGGESVA